MELGFEIKGPNSNFTLYNILKIESDPLSQRSKNAKLDEGRGNPPWISMKIHLYVHGDKTKLSNISEVQFVKEKEMKSGLEVATGMT